jgi:hypothetical protein
MAAFELPLVGLLSATLTGLALAGRGRPPPAWAALFGPAAIAWIAGVQGLMFRRQPDYMVAYLFEARPATWIAYLGWCAAAIGLAWAFASWLQRAVQAGSWQPVAVFLGALVVGLLSLLLESRLALIGSTYEFRQGMARPLADEPAIGTLLSLTAIGSFVPVAGAAALVAADGIRAARRRSP